MKFLQINVLILTLLFLSSCSIAPEKTKVSTYNFSINQDLITFKKDNVCTSKPIKIGQPGGVIGIQDTRIYYSKYDGQLQSYRDSYWAELPSISLKRDIYRSIVKSNIFPISIQDSYSFNEGYTLNVDVLDFRQVVEEGSSYVQFDSMFVLLDSKSNKVIGAKEINIKKQANFADARGTVVAFNEASTQVNTQLVEWLGEIVCK